MSNNLKIHHRKSIRLKGFDYSRAGGYFVTVVSYHRECLLGKVEEGTMCVNALGKIAQEYWDDIPVHFENVNVDIFVVMPNHVHGILFIRENDTVHVGAQHFVPVLGGCCAPTHDRVYATAWDDLKYPIRITGSNCPFIQICRLPTCWK